MIPYYPEPVLRVGFIAIHAFSVLLAAAVVLGGYIMIKRACRFGFNRDLMLSIALWAAGLGLIGADLAKLIIDYHPLFAADPTIIFTTSRGIRSLGAFAGGLLGAVIGCRYKRLSLFDTFRILDIMTYALPFAFLVGRLGCALAHDHPGIASDSWIAVRFPEGSRYDLGLIEFLFLIPLSAAFLWLDRRPHRTGFFLGLYAISYGAFRVWLDTLHDQPMRFYGGVAGCLIGAIAWIIMFRTSRDRSGTAWNERVISLS